MELLHYLNVLRRRWMLLAASVLLSLIVAALMTARMSPQYASSITLVVSAPDQGGTGLSAYQAVLSSRERVKSYAKLMQSQSVTTRVAAALDNGITADDLRPKISAQAVPDTVLLKATVTDRSPALAMRIGHTLGVEFSRYVDGLERAKPDALPDARITVADDAELPMTPVSPRPMRNLALGLVAGLVIGAAAALLRDLTDTTVRSLRALRAAAGGTALGLVSLDRGIDQRPLAIRDDANATQAEAFRQVRTNLRFACGEDLPRSVVITSAQANEGRSMVACNLAHSLAELGLKVILVDADLRGSGLTESLGVETAPGLTNVIGDGRPVADCLLQWGSGTLSVLPSGPLAGDSGEILANRRLAAIVREVERTADIVLLDTPPLLARSDAAILARNCTGAVLVTRFGKTRGEDVSEAADRLATVHAEVLGAVLSFVPSKAGRFRDLPWPSRQAEPQGLTPKQA